jgi:hypothetical protein
MATGSGESGGAVTAKLRVVNSKMSHAADRALERNVGYSSKAEAVKALQEFGENIVSMS